MQEFINLDRNTPEVEDTLSRIKHYKEIYKVFEPKKAGVQASRCVQCGDPYCSSMGCPLGNYIPHWLKAIAEKDLKRAFELSNETSPFPEILGRICPQDKLCEGSCTLNEDGYGAVTIGSIETAISENGFKEGFKLAYSGVTSDKKVAIIGSGPAGISCATFLLRAGIKVVMFEKDSVAGGLLVWGIPGFKLDKSVVQRRFDMLKEAGLELKLNCEVGVDISFDEIKKEYDAVFIGIGASKSNSLNIDGVTNKNVINAIDFLRDLQSKLFGKKDSLDVEVKDKKVVVIGGGDTAMDCLRSSVREGAKSVTCLYRRDEANMPGSKKEFVNANDEGVEFVFLTAPKKINIDENGNIKSITCVKMQLDKDSSSGRQKVSEVANSEFEVEADVVILALGFSHQDTNIKKDFKLDSWGGFSVDTKNYETSSKLIYAGGDCVRGADLAVTASRDGRIAALDIIDKLL